MNQYRKRGYTLLGLVLTRMIGLGVVRIFLSRSGFFRLCAGKGRYLDARHCNQYPQHTDERLLTISPSNHPIDVYALSSQSLLPVNKNPTRYPKLSEK